MLYIIVTMICLCLLGGNIVGGILDIIYNDLVQKDLHSDYSGSLSSVTEAFGDSYFPIINPWKYLDSVWIYFFLLWNIIPTVFVVWQITTGDSHSLLKHVKKMSEFDPRFFTIGITQISNIVLYFTIRIIQVYTLI